MKTPHLTNWRLRFATICSASLLFSFTSPILQAAEQARPGSLREALADARIFNPAFSGFLTSLADSNRSVFVGELLFGDGKVKATAPDMGSALFLSVALVKASDAKGSASPLMGQFRDGPWVALTFGLKTNVFVSGVTLPTIKERLGSPEGERVIEWAAMEVSGLGFPSASGQSERVALYFGSTIGFSDKFLWIDGPKFLKSLGFTNRTENVERSFTKTAEEIAALRAAASKGDTDAQFTLAGIYSTGNGTQKDPKEAAKWYEQAAQKGHADAAYNLATVFEYGLGVPADKAKATEWYRVAAKGGHAQAKSKLDTLEQR